MTCTRLFVYGTLRRDVAETKSAMFVSAAQFVSRGRTRGKLYRISWHPGMTPGGPGDWVTGELWTLNDAAESFRVLDEFEGTPYERIIVPVETGMGGTLDAWTYLYKDPVDESSRIGSGDWADIVGPA